MEMAWNWASREGAAGAADVCVCVCVCVSVVEHMFFGVCQMSLSTFYEQKHFYFC